MPVYKELDPEVLEQLLAPYKDEGSTELAKERKHEDAFLAQQKCPTCGSSGMTPFMVSSAHAFGHGNLLARSALRCNLCGAEYDPHSKIVLGTGNLAKAIECVQAGQVPGFGAEVYDEDRLSQIAERVKRSSPG